MLLNTKVASAVILVFVAEASAMWAANPFFNATHPDEHKRLISRDGYWGKHKLPVDFWVDPADERSFRCKTWYPSSDFSYRAAIGIPPRPVGPEPPFNVPTDEWANTIHEPLNKSGYPIDGPRPKVEQCCRINFACKEFLKQFKQSPMPLEVSMAKTDYDLWAAYNCCFVHYHYSCPNPQNDGWIYFNEPPRCSNPSYLRQKATE